jgi:uncharacterized short protein YbdD (DUF466 family)
MGAERIALAGRRAAGVVRAVSRALRAMLAVPDYERYLSHMRRSHPTCVPLTEGEFTRQRLDDRYSRPGARCC